MFDRSEEKSPEQLLLADDFSKQLQSKLEDIAPKLDKADPNAKERLTQLANVLIQKEDFGELANINVYGAFDLEGLEGRAAEQSLRQWSTIVALLEWARNVFILLPITFTWASFWLAAQDYTYAIQNNLVARTDSFLFIWETRFGGKPNLPTLTFSETAFLDAMLLCIIVVLTLLVHYRRDVARERAASDAAELRHKMEVVLWDIEMRFSEKRRLQTEAGVVDKLLTTVNEFKTLSESLLKEISSLDSNALEWKRSTAELDARLKSVVKTMTEEVDGLRGFSDGFKQYSKEMFEHTERASQLYESLDETIGDLRTSISGNGNSQKMLMTNIHGKLNELGEEAKAWGFGLRRVVDDLGASSTKNSDILKSVTKTVEQVTDLLKRQDNLERALAEVHGVLEADHKWMEATIETAKKAFEDVKTISQEAEANMVAVADTASAGIRDLKRIAAEELENTAATNSTRVQTMTEAVSSKLNIVSDALSAAAKRVEEASEKQKLNLDRMAQQYSDLTTDQTTALAEIRKDLRSIVNSLHTTMEAVIEKIKKLPSVRTTDSSAFPWGKLMLLIALSISLSSCLVGIVLFFLPRLIR